MTTPGYTVPTFSARDVPGAAELNVPRGLIRNIYDWAVGGFRRSPRPMAAVRLTAENREAVSATPYEVPFDDADIDTDDMWAAISSGSLWINTPGLWMVGFHARLVINTGVPATASLHGWICRNGTDPQTTAIAGGTSGDLGPTVDVMTAMPLARGDRLRFVVSQDSGITLGLAPDYATTRAWAVWLGP